MLLIGADNLARLCSPPTTLAGDVRPPASRSAHVSRSNFCSSLRNAWRRLSASCFLVLSLLAESLTSWSWLSARSIAARARSSWALHAPRALRLTPPLRRLCSWSARFFPADAGRQSRSPPCVLHEAVGFPCPEQSASAAARASSAFSTQSLQVRPTNSALPLPGTTKTPPSSMPAPVSRVLAMLGFNLGVFSAAPLTFFCFRLDFNDSNDRCPVEASHSGDDSHLKCTYPD